MILAFLTLSLLDPLHVPFLSLYRYYFVLPGFSPGLNLIKNLYIVRDFDQTVYSGSLGILDWVVLSRGRDCVVIGILLIYSAGHIPPGLGAGSIHNICSNSLPGYLPVCEPPGLS